MGLTKAQRAHRDYLQTDHWFELRNSAIERDGGKCVRCGDSMSLQVHHKVYRDRFELGVLEDVETLCERCHRIEHGLPVRRTEFQLKRDEIFRHCDYLRRPPVSLWRDMKSLMRNDDDDLSDFADMMFKFVLHVWSHETEGGTENWWLDKKKSDFWFNRAFNIRKSINER